MTFPCMNRDPVRPVGTFFALSALSTFMVTTWVLPAPVGAQTLAPVAVTATRTELPPFDVPASVDVVDGESIRGDGRAQVNLAESLSLLPGLLARDRLNQA